MASFRSLLLGILLCCCVFSIYAQDGPDDHDGPDGPDGGSRRRGGHRDGKGCRGGKGGKGGDRRLKGEGPGTGSVASMRGMRVVEEEVVNLTSTYVEVSDRRLQDEDDMVDDEECEDGLFDSPMRILGLVLILVVNSLCIGCCCYWGFHWYYRQQNQKQLQQQQMQQRPGWGGMALQSAVPAEGAHVHGVVLGQGDAAEAGTTEPMKPSAPSLPPTTVVVGSPVNP